QEYRKTLARMRQEFGTDPDGPTAYALAWVCVLCPESGLDAGQVTEWAERAVKAFPDSADALETLGAALYRAGRYADAVRRLEEAAKLRGAGGGEGTHLFLAMAHARLGHAEEARRWSQRAGAGWERRREQVRAVMALAAAHNGGLPAAAWLGVPAD